MNIFENRLLKSKILRLKEFIERQSQQQKINAQNLEREINSQIEHIKSAEKISDSDKIGAKNIESLKTQLKSNEENFKISPNKILEMLNKCLTLSVFDGVENCNEKWRMTQIFTNDANYRRAYLKLKELDEIFDFSFDADEKSFPAAKMFQIYEWWILAKIIEFLVVKLQFKVENSPDNPVEILSRLFSRIESTQNATIRLTHENSKMEMEIFYNTEIKDSLKVGNCILRPDYLFKVTDDKTTKFFILDAKYRNYEQQGYNYWKEKDLRGVCLEKYIQKIKRYTGKEISMSFIVHSDWTTPKDKFWGEYVVYNANIRFEKEKLFAKLNGELQQVGSFYFFPNVEKSEINLSLFFKMMFEYFMEKWQICWECGSNNVESTPGKTKANKPKCYYNCKNCGAFWVKTHCGNCSNKLIIKHAINYHEEQKKVCGKKSKWYVCCPKCGG